MNRKILLIEDNPTEVEIITKMLRMLKVSYEIEHVVRLNDAIKLLQAKNQYDVILSDLTLPDSFGLNTFVKLNEHVGGIPVIVLTNLDDDDVADKFIEIGAEDYIFKKDISPDLLTTALRNAIARTSSMVSSSTVPSGASINREPSIVNQSQGLTNVSSELKSYRVSLSKYLKSTVKDILPDVFKTLVDDYLEIFVKNNNSTPELLKRSLQQKFAEHREAFFMLKISPQDIYEVHQEAMKLVDPALLESSASIQSQMLFEACAILFEAYDE